MSQSHSRSDGQNVKCRCKELTRQNILSGGFIKNIWNLIHTTVKMNQTENVYELCQLLLKAIHP